MESTKLTRSEKTKLRREKLKSENPEEYRRRQDLENEKSRQRYREMKETNPEEWRQKQDLKNKMSRTRRNQKRIQQMNERHFSSGDYKTPERTDYSERGFM